MTAYGGATTPFVTGTAGGVPARTPRRIESAIAETERAISRTGSVIEILRQNADRLCGTWFPPTGGAELAKLPSPPPTNETDNLSTTLANLHAHLDTLTEQANRFEGL